MKRHDTNWCFRFRKKMKTDVLGEKESVSLITFENRIMWLDEVDEKKEIKWLRVLVGLFSMIRHFLTIHAIYIILVCTPFYKSSHKMNRWSAALPFLWLAWVCFNFKSII